MFFQARTRMATSSHQRIHPVVQDMEPHNRPPTEPLFPRGLSKSDTDDSAASSFRRTIPIVYSNHPKRRRSCCCCRLLCWILLLLLLQLIIAGIAGSILYLVFQPKLPKFTIDRLQLTQFNLSSNNNLLATFDVTLTARNPNEKIGIYYEGGSNIAVQYRGSTLCQGALPEFYQGHRNTTVLDVFLSGRSQNATAVLTSLQEDRQETGVIPLNLRVKQTVRIKLGKLKLMKVKFLVRCRLDVDSLSTGNAIRIKNNKCKFRLKL